MAEQTLRFQAEVPSNLAIIKYWGKKPGGKQIPANDSVSFGLKNSLTRTIARRSSEPSSEFFLDSQKIDPKSEFGQKIYKHIEFLKSYVEKSFPLIIESKNTFPDSCGIASSASGIGALTLACVAAWTGSNDLVELNTNGYSLQRLANLARMGSGSASRSFFADFVHWHASDEDEQSFTRQTCHWNLSNIIVLISTEKKTISSSKAHAFAWKSPLFEPRLAGLPRRIGRLKAAIERADFAEFGETAETDCLDMHSIMMTGEPAVCFLKPATIEFISWLRRERYSTDLPAYFSIDAGANVHVICEEKDRERVSQAIASAFPQYEALIDGIGSGVQLKTF